MADIALAPVNNRGTVGKLNGMVMREYGYPVSKMPLPTEFQKGYAQIHSAKDNDRLIIFVVTLDGNKTGETLLTNLTKALIDSALLLNNKRIWLPLMGTGAGRLSFKQSYDLTIMAIQDAYKHLNGSYEFLIAFPEEKEAIALLDTFKNEPDFVVPGMPKEKMHTDSLLPDTIKDNIYALGSTWGDDDKTNAFLDDNTWVNGFEDKLQGEVNGIELGSIIVLKSAYYHSKDKVPYFRVKAIGVVTRNHANGTHLSVFWPIRTGNIDLTGSLSSKRETYHKLSIRELEEILKGIKVNNNDLEELLVSHKKEIGKGERVSNIPTIPGNHSDAVDGPDYFNIKADVQAFAKLIASEALKPPLAIALFGAWGGGKSFFMKNLQKEVKILSDSKEKDKEEQLLYKEGISQIHFNAWSYLDANLWASIVSRIFEGIQEYISGKGVKDEFREKVETELTKDLSLTKEEREDLKQLKEQANELLSELKRERRANKGLLKRKIKEVKQGSVFDAIKKADKAFDVSNTIKKEMGKVEGLQENWNELNKVIPSHYLEDPTRAYQEVNSKVFFFKEFFRPEKVRCNITLLLFITLLAVLIPVLLQHFSNLADELSFIWAQTITPVLIFVGPALARIRSVSQKISPIVNKLWKVKTDYERRIQEVTEQHAQRMLALEQEIKITQQHIDTVHEQVVAKQEEIHELNFKLEHALSTESLHLFIKNRMQSEDYKKHLGLVSLIRKDFGILSNLFVEHGEEFEKNKKQRDKFLKMFNRPLQRIVLYIDDLDRCPEDRVIEVLEAVHLLMAFPLFAVVVGVDPRWVKNALIKQYSTQFAGNDTGEYRAAKASDYLEKIFQIPFHLKQANDDSVKFMLDELTKNFVVKPENNEEQDPTNQQEESATVPDPDKSTIKKQDQKKPVKEEEKPSPHLELSPEEVLMIKGFSEVLGKNPRAIKRFVNTYMVIKAHEGLRQTEGKEALELQFIAFMLALSVGPYSELVPHLRRFFENEKPRKLATFFAKNNVISNDKGDSDEDKMKLELYECLKVQKHLLTENLNQIYKDHSSFVKRFTFSELT